jgi:hypothetical protein
MGLLKMVGSAQASTKKQKVQDRMKARDSIAGARHGIHAADLPARTGHHLTGRALSWVDIFRAPI